MINKTLNLIFAFAILLFVLAPLASAHPLFAQDTTLEKQQDQDKDRADNDKKQDANETDDDASKDDQKQDDEEKSKKADSKKSKDESSNEEPKKDNPKADSNEDESKKKAEPKAAKRPDNRRATRYERNSSTSKEFVSLFSPAVASVSSSTVVVTDGRRQIGMGMIVNSSGMILTKASILKGKLTCKLADGTKQRATVIGLDPKTDLALLKIEADELTAARLDPIDSPKVGSWLATAGVKQNALSVGVVGVNARLIKPSRALMGVYLADLDPKLGKKGVRVNRVTPDSPAWRADIRVNDVIVAVDGIDTPDRDILIETVSNYAPGDRVRVSLMRGENKLNKSLTLGDGNQINPMMERSNQQNRLGSTLSKRRNDFPLAIQHDSVVQANQCGGPIVDLSGHIVGVNIARSGRVSTLALPIEIVIPVIENLISGKFSPALVNKTKIESIQLELGDVTKDLTEATKARSKLEIEFNVEKAREEELERILKQHETRLAELKKSREASEKKLTTEKKRINKGKLRQERLEADLKQLSSGVRK